MKFSKYGSFQIYVDDEFLMTVRCFYGDLLDLLWPIHYNNPEADVVVVQDSE